MQRKKRFYFGICGFFLLRIWALEGFAIDSTAMQPNLKIGDWIWVNKLPFTQVHKNDIIAFRSTTERKSRHVKRCIGLAGDTIQGIVGQYGVLPTFITPRKGQRITLTEQNFALYQPIIQAYEHKQASRIGEDFYINNQITQDYTFTQNYFYTTCDNQAEATDCGLMPEFSLIGKALFVW
jgi:signal peptidase I